MKWNQSYYKAPSETGLQKQPHDSAMHEKHFRTKFNEAGEEKNREGVLCSPTGTWVYVIKCGWEVDMGVFGESFRQFPPHTWIHIYGFRNTSKT